jgi:hypothetical protein
MELIFTVLKYIGLGFVGFIGLFILIMIVFGKRIEKQWAVRADFKDPDSGDPVGKLEVAKERVAGGESDFRLKVKCKLRHAMLRAGQRVRVTVGETAVMEGEVKQDGRLRLGNDAWSGDEEIPQPGSRVTIWSGSDALAAGELYLDFDPAKLTVKDGDPDVDIPRTARILKKSNAKALGLVFIVVGLASGYLAWQNDVSPVALGFIGLFPLTGLYFIFSNTTNILYLDNGRLGWYSRFNRQLHADRVPIEQIQSLKVKPYRLGRHGHYQAVIGLVDGFEIPLPDNLLAGNVVRYVEKHLLVELRRFKPSIEYILEEPMQGRPVNRVRLPADR